MKQKCQHLQLVNEKNKIMSKNKAIEICINLEQSINNITNKVIEFKNKMFDRPSISKDKLQSIQDRLIKKYKLTKKDLKWKK